MKKNVFTLNAPKPVGPYSQAVRAGNLLFISGTLPIDPKTGEMVKGEIEEMTRRILDNISEILKAESLSMKNLVKVNMFLRDMALFQRVNGVYKDYFGENPPARSAVGVASLPKNAEIEIEAVACYED